MVLKTCLPPLPLQSPVSVFFSRQPCADSVFLGFLQELEQGVIRPEGKGKGALLVVLWVTLQVLNHLCQQVSPLHPRARGFEAQGGEVHMQVVVGGQVVQVHTEAVRFHLVALQDSFLVRKGVAGKESLCGP